MEARSDSSDFWDQASGSRQFTHPLDHARFTKLITRDATIVDYGCGQGRLSNELIGLGYTHLLGLDSSPEMIRIARDLNPGGSFAVNDGQHLPSADQSVDAVLLFAVLTCIAQATRTRISFVNSNGSCVRAVYC